MKTFKQLTENFDYNRGRDDGYLEGLSSAIAITDRFMYDLKSKNNYGPDVFIILNNLIAAFDNEIKDIESKGN